MMNENVLKVRFAMKILKDNFYTVVKLWVNQFAMIFLGVLILLPTAGSDAKWLTKKALHTFTSSLNQRSR